MIAYSIDTADPATFASAPENGPIPGRSGRQDPPRVPPSDPEEFQKLYHACHRKIMSICRYMLRDEAEAKDACQDTFLRAWQFLSEFRGESAVSTWLIRIAYNRCFEKIRKSAQMRLRAQQWAQKPDYAPDDPGDTVLHRFFLEKAMTGMGTRQRFVLGLILEDGLNHAEAADQLNVSRPAISRQMARIRGKLLGKG